MALRGLARDLLQLAPLQPSPAPHGRRDQPASRGNNLVRRRTESLRNVTDRRPETTRSASREETFPDRLRDRGGLQRDHMFPRWNASHAIPRR